MIKELKGIMYLRLFDYNKYEVEAYAITHGYIKSSKEYVITNDNIQWILNEIV